MYFFYIVVIVIMYINFEYIILASSNFLVKI